MTWNRIRAVQSLASGRWEPAALITLRHGPMRSAQLRQAISPGPSYKAFSETLHGLQKKGFVQRVERRGPGRRKAVSSRLTDEGAVIVDLLARVVSWALAHSRDLPTAQLAGPGRGGTTADDAPSGAVDPDRTDPTWH